MVVSKVSNKFDSGDRCPECGSHNIIRDKDSGEAVCSHCGLVLKEYILDKGPEWRAFTQSEKMSRSRMGLPLSFSVHDKGLSTMIGRVGRDASGRKIPQKKRIKMLRLRKWQIRSRVHSSIDRNLSKAMTELDRLSDKLYIPQPTKEKAAVFYRKSLDKDLVRGRSISAMAAASLYAACRFTQTPRKIEEIAQHSRREEKDIARCYRLILKELRLHMPVPKPQNRVPKIAAKARIGQKSQQTAVQILRKARRIKTTAGKDPTGLAAAALYIACLMNDENLTQKMIANAAGVTEVTIRNRYKGLKKALKLDI